MKKASALLLALALLVLPVYAVLIELSSANIDQIGSTGRVEVRGPGTVSKVKWIMTQTAPYKVDKVEIRWTPASSSSFYTVYVTIYDNNDVVKSSGRATGQYGGGQITTTVDLDNIDPRDIYQIEIIIVEE